MQKTIAKNESEETTQKTLKKVSKVFKVFFGYLLKVSKMACFLPFCLFFRPKVSSRFCKVSKVLACTTHTNHTMQRLFPVLAGGSPAQC